MGMSADARLFYGAHIDTDGDTPDQWEELESMPKKGQTYGYSFEGWLESLGVEGIEVISVGHSEYGAPAVVLKKSEIWAWDYTPKEADERYEPSAEEKETVAKVVKALQDALGDEPDYEFSNIGWWLAPSYG